MSGKGTGDFRDNSERLILLKYSPVSEELPQNLPFSSKYIYRGNFELTIETLRFAEPFLVQAKGFPSIILNLWVSQQFPKYRWSSIDPGNILHAPLGIC